MNMNMNDEQTYDLPTPEWVMVGPAEASTMLEANTHNRNLKSKHRQYADDMANGSWRWEICDPLRFSDCGVLLDGQNRLQAVILSGVTLPFLVVRGLPMTTQTVMDTGVGRKLGDVLKLQGEDHYNALATVVRLCWELGRGTGFINKGKASNSTLLAFLADNPDLRLYATNTQRRVADSCDLPQSIIAGFWWTLAKIDKEDADDFFTRLGQEAGHLESEPIFELRRTLSKYADAKKGGGERDRLWMMAVTVKAWNAYRDGRTVALYKWSPGGRNPEAFPVAR